MKKLVKIENAKVTVEITEQSELNSENAELFASLLSEAIAHYSNHVNEIGKKIPNSLVAGGVITSFEAFTYFKEDIAKIVAKGKINQDNLYVNAIDSLIDECYIK